MSIQIISRAAIMLSALDAVREGKTIRDCPPLMQPYRHTWEYEFKQAKEKLETTTNESR